MHLNKILEQIKRHGCNGGLNGYGYGYPYEYGDSCCA